MADARRQADECSAKAAFLQGGGEMGERIRAFDWSRTPLGPTEQWPQNLKEAVAICLGSRMPIVIWWDREQAIQFYNDAYISFLGPTKHPAFLGRSGRECWREIWDTMGPLWDKVFAAGEATWSEDFLYVINRKLPREEGYFTFSYSPIRGAMGVVDGIFCACYETTGKVVGARRLETLRRLGGQAMEADSVTDACERAASVLNDNRYDIPFARIYLLDSNGGLPADTIAPQELASVLQTRRPADLNGLELPGGPWPESTTQAVAFPLFLSRHETIAGLIVLGVSPRRPLDPEYRAFFDLVAGHVSTAMANARAHEEERRRAEALAEVDRAKTVFFSNVSHEFRTPLTLMLGHIEDLLSRSHTELPPVAASQLEVAHRNSLRLLKLVNTLLDFSRIEAGRMEAVFEPTDLGAFTAELASMFRAATERAGLKLTVDCPNLPMPVYVDRDMWEKIVLNLISNAFKFTMEGGIEITLRVEGQTPGAPMAVLRVRDTGVGIPEKEMPRLFERFHRIQAARSRTDEGSGIGLALVQELVKLHGGSVRAESRLGEGTTFIVSVPLGKDHLPADRIGNARPVSSTATGALPYVEEALRWLPEKPREPLPPLQKHNLVAVPYRPGETDESRPRVLIADDNADMRGYLARLLTERYNVETVPDGQAALEAARKCRPDLVLNDVMMPQLDGMGLVREMRADPSLNTVPIILLSARAGEESRVEGMQHGADDYVIKPFSARELQARVAAHLEMARLRKEAEEALRRVNQELERRVDERTAELVEAGEKVKAERQRFLEMLDTLPVIIDIIRQDKRIEWANRAYRQALGDNVGRLCFESQFGRREPCEECEAFVPLQTGQPHHWEWTLPSGRTFEIHNFPFAAADGSPAILEVDIDVTDRRKAEAVLKDMNATLEQLVTERTAELRQSAQQLQDVIDGAPGPVFIKDLEGRFLTINRTLEGLLRMSREDLRGKTDYDIFPKDRADHYREHDRRVAESGAPIQVEEVADLADGRHVFLANKFPLRDLNGGVYAVCSISADITERKQAEVRLLESQKLESTGLLAGGVAHDFNNLLVGVIGNASLIEDMLPPDHPASELVRGVLKTGEQLAHLTRQMLAYAGKGKFFLETLDVSAVVRDVSDLIRPSIPKKIALHLDLRQDLPPVEADRGQVQQVLMNLALNAAEAIGSQDGLITVRTYAQPVDQEYLRLHPEAADLKTGEYVALEVRDTGCGMDDAVKPKIFDPFFSTKFTGRGLGLAAVSGIMRGHKGAILVSSAPGHGTTFTVLFPAAARPAKRAPAAVPADVQQGSGVVLVIDDEQVVREMAKKALERSGYTVLVADGGLPAIDIFKRHPGQIDLAVLDLSMPDMSGEEALPELKRIRPEVKVLVSSGYSEAEAMKMFEGQQVVGFVQKPYTSAVLAEKVKRSLESEHNRGQ